MGQRLKIMKPLTETNAPFDRISTREELFQVIELLGAAGTSLTLQKNPSVPTFVGTEQFVDGDMAAQSTDLWAEVSTEEELALAAEIQPLADLFLGKRQRIN
jgi:hypothetical protein